MDNDMKKKRHQNIFLAFILKESMHILRDVRTMIILFAMPVLLMLLFGFAIRNDVRNVRTVVVTSQVDEATTELMTKLGASEYFTIVGTAANVEEAKQWIRSQQADIALTFSPRVAGKRKVEMIVDGVDPNMSQQYAAYAQGVLMGGMGQVAALNYLYNPRMLSAYNFVPGVMGMLLLLICAMMTSISIVKEKERGAMEVLLVSPVKPIFIILSKAVPYFLLALTIMVTILAMAHYLLDVPLAGSLFWIVMISLLYILLALSLGLLVSNVAQTQIVALLFSAMIFLLPTVMLSGMIFPTSSMPEILQWISVIVPARWYIDAMRRLMIMGVGIDAVLQDVAVLAGMTLLLLTISIATFKTRLK